MGCRLTLLCQISLNLWVFTHVNNRTEQVRTDPTRFAKNFLSAVHENWQKPMCTLQFWAELRNEDEEASPCTMG